jgi:uncharacterized protein (DUF2345 family)
MYSAGYGFSNNAAPSFNNPAPQQQSGAQPAAQQMMYNQQQQFAGMTPQGGFNPGANPQMMGAGPGGMMPNAGMQHMAANGQSRYHFFIARNPRSNLSRRACLQCSSKQHQPL